MVSCGQDVERIMDFGKKHESYGQAIGILMQSDDIARIPGDAGNATTFDFPVKYEIIPVVSDVLKDPEQAIKHADAWIAASVSLERQGVKAITAGCGFTAILQPLISKAVKIPVFSSSLIQVPMVYSMLRNDQKVGIITADKSALSERYFEAVGWSRRNIPVAIAGLEKTKELQTFLRASKIAERSKQEMEDLLSGIAVDFVRSNPDIGAIVLECTNLPPYARGIREAVQLPVFDIVTLTNWVFEAVVQKRYKGFI